MPISLCGVVLALVALLTTRWLPKGEGALAVAGLMVASLALGVALAVDYAPLGFEPAPRAPRLQQPAESEPHALGPLLPLERQGT